MGDPVVSDRNLRAFVSAARFGSLTRAAQHLGLGQPAIGRAVARLEAELGVRLLERSRLGVEPTPIGAELLAVLGPAYRAVDEAVRSVHGPRRRGDVSLSVSTSLASWWLLPRLPEFKRHHPDVSLRLISADADHRVDPADVDLWVPLGSVSRDDVRSEVLCREVITPVVAPRLLCDLPELIAPSDLVTAPLLHLEEFYDPRYDWFRWFADHEVTVPHHLPGDRSNDYSVIVQAALDGQGVALGWMHVVADLIEAGRLVALAPPVITDSPFTVLWRADGRLSEGADALRRWLVDSMNETIAPYGDRWATGAAAG